MEQFKFLIFAFISVTLVSCTSVLGNNKKSHLVQKNLTTYNVGYNNLGNPVKFSVPPYFLRYMKEKGISPKAIGSNWLVCLKYRGVDEDIRRGEVMGAEIIDQNAVRIKVSTAVPNRYMYTSKKHYILTRMLIIIKEKEGRYETRCLAQKREDIFYGLDRQ
jgi:hypothetical protein